MARLITIGTGYSGSNYTPEGLLTREVILEKSYGLSPYNEPYSISKKYWYQLFRDAPGGYDLMADFIAKCILAKLLKLRNYQITVSDYNYSYAPKNVVFYDEHLNEIQFRIDLDVHIFMDPTDFSAMICNAWTNRVFVIRTPNTIAT